MSNPHAIAPLARSTDPQTSHDAATSNRQARQEQKTAILWLLANVGPMTDHELTWQYKRYRAQKNWPATRDDSVRKRRAELKNEGRVENSGKVSGFNGSAPSIVWAVTE